MSQAMTAVTATAAIYGDPIASMPRIINKTPQRIDHVEVCRTMLDVCCAILTSSMTTDGFYLKRREVQAPFLVSQPKCVSFAEGVTCKSYLGSRVLQPHPPAISLRSRGPSLPAS